MKLPTILNSKLNIGILSAVLTVGAVVGITDLSNKPDAPLHSTSTETAAPTADPVVTPPDPLTAQPAPSSATEINPGSTATTQQAPTAQYKPIPAGSAPNSTSTPPTSPATATSAPVTMTGQSQYVKENGSNTESWCHNTYSDGSTKEVFVGRAPTDQYQRGEIGFGSCPS